MADPRRDRLIKQRDRLVVEQDERDERLVEMTNRLRDIRADMRARNDPCVDLMYEEEIEHLQRDITEIKNQEDRLAQLNEGLRESPTRREKR